MKPSNLSGRMMVLNPAATRDEDSIERTSSPSVCAFLFWALLEKIFTKGTADLFVQLGITETSKYAKYSFGFCYLFRAKISRCPYGKSFSEPARYSALIL